MDGPANSVAIHPEVSKLLGPKEDLEQYINDILFIYLSGGFIRKSEVAGAVVVNKIYRKASVADSAKFETVAHEFSGVVVANEIQSQSVYISSDKLMDLLEENQVVMVLKSPRQKGISTVKCKVPVAPLNLSEDISN